MTLSLNDLKQRQLVWQGHQQAHAKRATVSSGFAELDAHLQGGWPSSGVVEIQACQAGIGELRLLFPCLEALASEGAAQAPGSQQQKPLQAWVNPPARLSPYPLQADRLSHSVLLHTRNDKEHLWVSEHLLKSGCCRTLVCWSPPLSTPVAKRLQLAAKEGNCLAFIIRYGESTEQSLPLSARLRLKPLAQGLEVEIVKRQQSWPVPPFELDLQSRWPQLFYPAASVQAAIQATIPAPDNIIAFPGSQAGKVG